MFGFFRRRDPVAIRRDYYRTAPLWLPPRPSQRQFRFAIEQGERTIFLKIRDRVKDDATLRRWLVRYAPLHAYFTTSTWLDPQNLGPRKLRGPGYRKAYNVYLTSELYFDIDLPGQFRQARREAAGVVSHLGNRWGFRDLGIVYSGSKGFHIHVRDFDLKRFGEVPLDPQEREAAAQEAKRKIVEDVLNQGFAIDVDTSLDTRRIIRLPGTIHGATGNLCEFVPMEHLGRFRPHRLYRARSAS